MLFIKYFSKKNIVSFVELLMTANLKKTFHLRNEHISECVTVALNNIHI